MKTRVKKILSYVCALLLVLGCMYYTSVNVDASNAGVTTTAGQPTKIDLSAIDGDIVITANGLEVYDQASSTSTTVETTLNSEGYVFTNSTTKYTITVLPDVTTEITLDNVSITGSGLYNYRHLDAARVKKYPSCIDVSKSNTTINLVGTNTLEYDSGAVTNAQGPCGQAGCLEKSGIGGKLVINGPGTLNATAKGFHDSCIGSNFGKADFYNNDGIRNFENITIDKGATVLAQSAPHMPGIGAACYGNKKDCKSKDITIKGGSKVTAYGGEACAGIGAGLGVAVDGIYISGGAEVTAYGGLYSPGIGSGGYYYAVAFNSFDVSNIVISGGDTVVTAYGDKTNGINVPGIGAGVVTNGGMKGKLTNVTATPDANYQGYVKYGTSDTNYSFSTANPKTPFPTSEEFGTYLQGESDDGNPVYYTQVYFGPYKDNNDIDANAEIGSNDTVLKTGGDGLSDADLIKLTVPSGHDENGSEINFTNYTLDPDETKAINDAKKEGKVGDFPLTYTYTYTDDTGEHTLTVESTVSLREQGDPQNGLSSIGGNGAIHKTGGAAFTDEEIIKLTDVVVNNELGNNAILKNDDGTLIIPDDLVIDAKELNDAKAAGKTGTYNVKYTYTTDGKTLTITLPVTLTDNGNETVTGSEIGANDAAHISGGKAFTSDEIKDLSEVTARDSNGNLIDKSELTPDAKQLATINAAKIAGRTGKFPITYTFTDPVSNKEVKVESYVTLYLGNPPTVVANDAITSITEAKKITAEKDLDKFLNPSVVIDSDGNIGEYSSMTFKNADDFTNIQNGVVGDYEITYNYQYLDEDGEQKTVSKTVIFKVVDKTTIDAKDTTISSDNSKENIKEEKDLITIMDGKVILDDGSVVEPDTVTLDNPTDIDNIKNGVPGIYNVTFSYTDPVTGKTISITKILTITDNPVIDDNNGNNTEITTTVTKTGDDTVVKGYIILSGITLVLILTLMIRRKKEVE